MNIGGGCDRDLFKRDGTKAKNPINLRVLPSNLGGRGCFAYSRQRRPGRLCPDDWRSQSGPGLGLRPQTGRCTIPYQSDDGAGYQLGDRKSNERRQSLSREERVR